MEENLILRSIMMKMRNMLRGVLFLLLMASGLGVFLSCKGISTTSTAYTVTFDAQGGSPVAPLEVEHGKTIAKPADPAKGSFAFDGWYKESTCTTPWNFATDTVTADITLFAKWKITIQFDPSKMTCWNNGTNTTVNAGDTVYENDELSFQAINLSAEQTVDKWKVNDTEKKQETQPSFGYRVRAEDVQSDGSIRIDYTVKTAAQATIHFDASKIKCWRNVDGSGLTGTLVADGGTVYEGDSLLLIAQPTAGKRADSWTVNGISQGDEQGNFYRYMVKEQPSELRFDYTEKPAKKVALQFDTLKIRCTKWFDQTPIMPGQRDEGDALIFRTVNSSTVQWKINGYEMGSVPTSFLSITLVKDFGNGNVLKISYE